MLAFRVRVANVANLLLKITKYHEGQALIMLSVLM